MHGHVPLRQQGEVVTMPSFGLPAALQRFFMVGYLPNPEIGYNSNVRLITRSRTDALTTLVTGNVLRVLHSIRPRDPFQRRTPIYKRIYRAIKSRDHLYTIDMHTAKVVLDFDADIWAGTFDDGEHSRSMMNAYAYSLFNHYWEVLLNTGRIEPSREVHNHDRNSHT